MNMPDVKWVVLEIHFSVLKCNEPKVFSVPSKQIREILLKYYVSFSANVLKDSVERIDLRMIECPASLKQYQQPWQEFARHDIVEVASVPQDSPQYLGNHVLFRIRDLVRIATTKQINRTNVVGIIDIIEVVPISMEGIKQRLGANVSNIISRELEHHQCCICLQ